MYVFAASTSRSSDVHKINPGLFVDSLPRRHVSWHRVAKHAKCCRHKPLTRQVAFIIKNLKLASTTGFIGRWNKMVAKSHQIIGRKALALRLFYEAPRATDCDWVAIVVVIGMWALHSGRGGGGVP